MLMFDVILILFILIPSFYLFLANLLANDIYGSEEYIKNLTDEIMEKNFTKEERILLQEIGGIEMFRRCVRDAIIEEKKNVP